MGLRIIGGPYQIGGRINGGSGMESSKVEPKLIAAAADLGKYVDILTLLVLCLEKNSSKDWSEAVQSSCWTPR